MPAIHHDEHLADRAVMLGLRSMLAASGRPALAPETRGFFDEITARGPSAEGIAYEAGEVGGVAGWWCRPASAIPDAAILYLHGGAYVLGSAAAYRHFAGQVATRAQSATFVADYALAPERPFPAAFDNASAVLDGLRSQAGRIALCGDSAGAGLALALLLQAGARAGTTLAAAAAFSPWIDLSLSGETMETRRAADPLLSRETLALAAQAYLREADPGDPRGTALNGDVAAMPPVRIHVGDDEVLLDDSLRFTTRAQTAGRICEAHVWKGMTHVFPSNPLLQAAGEALDDVGAFLRSHLGGGDLS